MFLSNFRRAIFFAGGALIMAALLPAESMAQSAYPTGPGMRAGSGSDGYFDVAPGKSHTIADLDDDSTYRVCILGKSGKLIVDSKKQVPLDNGDCHDTSGKNFVFEAAGGEGEAHGYYRHIRRHQ